MIDPKPGTGPSEAAANGPAMVRVAVHRFDGEPPATWLRLVYSQSFAEQPVRHLLRLTTASGADVEHVMPAPVLGRARWLGIVPSDCTGFEVWSCADAGTSFTLDRIAFLNSAQLALRIALANPARLPAFLLSLIRDEPRTRMLRALTALDLRPLSAFETFARSRSRPVEERDFVPQPRGDTGAIDLVFVVPVAGHADSALNATLRSLIGQADGAFRVHLVTAGSASDADRFKTQLGKLDATVSTLATFASAMKEASPPDEDRWIAEIRPGDTLVPEAVLAIRNFIAASGPVDVVYTDSAIVDGARTQPILRPDWSPTFYEGVAYIDRLCLVRITGREPVALDPRAGLRHWIDRLLLGARTTGLRVAHLRRILVTVQAASAEPLRVGASPQVAPTHDGTASIIIPTRDQVELLRAAIDSLRADLAGDGLEIVVVDNGSTDRDCLAYLQELRARDGVTVLDRPGTFNFSALVNAGAASAKGNVLILLNNDCAVLHEGWLQAMTSLARVADVGAVGAKLLYDDGRLQHAGVGIGLGGEAGHRDRRLPADHPGYLQRLRVVHETSAVTAACLAVERTKFHAVGGFDEAFAVAFNDIDFCLRLRARGFRNLFTPHATLRHSESVSRGSDRHPSQRERWSREAALFRSRWQHVILDDPYMHPLLSLWRFREILQ